MGKHQANATNTSANSKQVPELTDQELTEDELALVSGGTPSVATNDIHCHIHPN
jgi:bacteriocin-like protein